VLGDCPSLEVVCFKVNCIAVVPAAALPPALRWLILTNNDIHSLPPELGNRPALQKLMLAGNQLDRLPSSLAGAQRLELVRLAANQIPAMACPSTSWLPVWLRGSTRRCAPRKPNWQTIRRASGGCCCH